MSTGLAIRSATAAPSTVATMPSLEEMQTLGQVFTKSGFFSDTKDAAQAIVKIMAGAELGFPAIASMTGIYIVKGKVSLSANLMAAAIKRCGKYNYRVRQHTAEICEIEFFENGQSVGVSTFTKADATKAQTQNMDKFARNMLFARAMSNGARWYCADIFGGAVYTPDELGERVNEDGEVIESEPAPAKQSAAPVAAPPAAMPADDNEPLEGEIVASGEDDPGEEYAAAKAQEAAHSELDQKLKAIFIGKGKDESEWRAYYQQNIEQRDIASKTRLLAAWEKAAAASPGPPQQQPVEPPPPPAPEFTSKHRDIKNLIAALEAMDVPAAETRQRIARVADGVDIVERLDNAQAAKVLHALQQFYDAHAQKAARASTRPSPNPTAN